MVSGKAIKQEQEDTKLVVSTLVDAVHAYIGKTTTPEQRLMIDTMMALSHVVHGINSSHNKAWKQLSKISPN